ncbi:MAG: hypothetical protein Ct9H300mP4_16010 [Gammaproteobacteria bacterium]|nr:MAG: hypothetical protein Ct9H300mP4_16010 [Gammaproteobacteria bacterium]
MVVSDRDADAGFLVRVIDQSRLAGAKKVHWQQKIICKKKKKRGRREEIILPNDGYCIIMLIFFIVTKVIYQRDGINPNRPEAETAIRAEQGNILIAIAPNDQIWMKKVASS